MDHRELRETKGNKGKGHNDLKNKSRQGGGKRAALMKRGCRAKRESLKKHAQRVVISLKDKEREREIPHGELNGSDGEEREEKHRASRHHLFREIHWPSIRTGNSIPFNLTHI